MKTIFKIFLASLILSLICCLLRAWNLYYAAIVESLIYCCATIFLLNKFSNNRGKEIVYILLAIILGRIILELPLRITDWEGTQMTLMVTVLAVFGIILGGLIYYKKNVYKTILLMACWGSCIFVGHEKWLNHVISSHLPQTDRATFVVASPEKAINLDTIKSDYILLNFWTSSCKPCTQEMPKFQQVYNKYKGKLLVRSVFVTYNEKERITEGMDIVKQEGCDFPVWAIGKNNLLLKLNNWNIGHYPVTVIANRDKKVIFKGSLEKAEEELHNILNY